MQCLSAVQQSNAACPLCRTPFPRDMQLMLNRELQDLIALAKALHTVSANDDGWQTVTVDRPRLRVRPFPSVFALFHSLIRQKWLCLVNVTGLPKSQQASPPSCLPSVPHKAPPPNSLWTSSHLQQSLVRFPLPALRSRLSLLIKAPFYLQSMCSAPPAPLDPPAPPRPSSSCSPPASTPTPSVLPHYYWPFLVAIYDFF